MARMRMSHNYHESKVINPETFCTKCWTATPRVCEWCGACYTCHKGTSAEKHF